MVLELFVAKLARFSFSTFSSHSLGFIDTSLCVALAVERSSSSSLSNPFPLENLNPFEILCQKRNTLFPSALFFLILSLLSEMEPRR